MICNIIKTLSLLVFLFVHTANATSSDLSETAIQNAILQQINHYRLLHGLPKLTMDKRIVKEARLHSQNMASHKIAFGHQQFFARVKRLKSQIKPFGGAAENVAYNYKSASDVVNGWLKSPGHKANIDGRRYRLTGIGVVKDAQGKLYFTQLFLA